MASITRPPGAVAEATNCTGEATVAPADGDEMLTPTLALNLALWPSAPVTRIAATATRRSSLSGKLPWRAADVREDFEEPAQKLSGSRRKQRFCKTNLQYASGITRKRKTGYVWALRVFYRV